MNDRTSTKPSIRHIKKILKILFNRKKEKQEEIINEAYLQVLKQMKDHKVPEKALRGWNALAILASCVCPNQKLSYSIMNYLLMEIESNTDPNMANRMNYIFARLYRSHLSPRNLPPSEGEINHIEQMTQINLQINLFSEEGSIIIPIESYTTARELKDKLMKNLEYSPSRSVYFSLYEVCLKKDKTEERFIDDNEKLCDVLSLWEKETIEMHKNKEIIEFKIYLKIFIYFSYTESDIETVDFIYSQAVYDVLNSKFNLKEQDVVTLAALQMLVKFSNNQATAFSSLQKNLEKYVPSNQIGLNPATYWTEKIMELYTKLQSTSMEAKLTYIEHLKSSPLWEAHQFSAVVN